MLNYLYIIGELILLVGLFVYVLYNIFSKREVILTHIVRYKLLTSSVINLLSLLDGSVNLYKKSWFYFLGKFLSQYKFFSFIKNYLSEKNSLFYIGFLFLFVGFIYAYQTFIFYSYVTSVDINPYLNNRLLFFNGSYVVDLFSFFLKSIICFLAFFFLVICHHVSFFWKFYKYELGYFVYLFLFSMIVLLSANDFIFTFFSLEIQALSAIILVSFEVTFRKSIEAGFKYFLVNGILSIISALVICIVYAMYGTVFFEELYNLTVSSVKFNQGVIDYSFMFSMIIFTFYILTKLGIFPLYSWLADVYEGSPLLITAFLATISKIGLLGLLIRLSFNVFNTFFGEWSDFFMYIALISMLVTSIGALFQTNLKRFLGYTSLVNMSFMIAILTVGELYAFGYSIYFMCIYFFSSLVLFLFFLGVVYKERINDDQKWEDIESNHIINLKDMQGLFKSNKLISFSLLISVLNLIGMPPLPFFVAKYNMFEAFIDNGLFLTALLFLVSNLIGVFYYLRPIKILFFDRSINTKIFMFESRKLAILFYFGVIILVILGIKPYIVISFVEFCIEIVIRLFNLPY